METGSLTRSSYGPSTYPLYDQAGLAVSQGTLLRHRFRSISIANIGVQSDLWSLTDGFSLDEVLSISLSAANHSPISIEEAFFAKLAAQSGSSECNYFPIRYSTLDSRRAPFHPLGDSTGIPPKRETLDKQPHAYCTSHKINAKWTLDDRCPVPTNAQNATCSCSQRKAASPPPPSCRFNV